MFLGIDLGTSGVKVLLMDGAQNVLGTATRRLTVARPHPSWSEQDPAAWITAMREAMAELAAAHDLSGVEGIGLSGQMHGAVVLDAGDRVIRPAILWNDSRSEAQARRLDADPQFRAISANVVFPGFTAPKLVWMAETEPEAFARVAMVLLPKDYLRLWLTGEKIGDMSDAAGTAWFDNGARAWSDALLAASGMRRAQMPPLVEGSAPAGGLRAEVAAEWGMRPGTVVSGGAGDGAATAVGAGSVVEGQGFVSIGTSGVILTPSRRLAPDPARAVHAFCHTLPGMWQHMGVILSASAALEWLAGILGATPAALTDALGPELRAPAEETFLPYLTGERTPHNDAAARGAFSGLSARTGRAELTQAVLEGVAFAFADTLEALRASGSDPETLLALGGGARSRYWLKAIATALGRPLLLPESGDYGAAFGAARLGLMAATGADPAAVCTRPRIAAEVEPDHSLAPAYAEKLQQFRAAYRAR